MAGKTVRYLKENAGRWFYRRRVPDRHHKTLGFSMWNRPCGDVSWGKAVSMISAWSEEDDRLIKSLDNPQVSIPVRQATEARKMTRTLDTAEAAIQAIVGSSINRSSIDVVDQIDLPRAAKLAIQRVDQNTLFDNQDRLIRYRTILSELFGAHARVPTDPDERDDFEHAKRKLERRIAELGGDRNTITAVAERFFEFAQIKPGVRVKYRHRIAKLVAMVGDVPVVHLTASQLRQFRDEQSKAMKVSSVKAMFTPIKGLLSFALEEELIELNPIGSVKFKREKRSKNE